MRPHFFQRIVASVLVVATVLVPTLGMPNAARAGWYDCETGIYYNRARYYHPSLGRYLERDPNGTALVLDPALVHHGASPMVTISMAYELQFADGMNFYQFVRSSPPNGTDPSGMWTYTDTMITAGLAGGLYTLADHYSHFRDKGSNWKLAAAFAKGAGMGSFTAMGFGWLSGALASYAGVSVGTAATAIGLMTSPTMLGLAVAEHEDAATYADSLMAKIDMGVAAVGIAGSHAAAFKLSSSAVLAGGKAFPSFSALKQELGAAGPNKAWHHIVEQRNQGRFGASAIQNTKNVIRLPKDVHERISAYYSSKTHDSKPLTVREWLGKKSFQEQYEFGLRKVRELGGDPRQIGK